jgi:hypothetical protein
MDRDLPETSRAEACGFCHVGYDGTTGSSPERSSYPTPRLHFSHQDHAAAGIGCTSCHRGIADATLGTRAHLPDMRACRGCHRRSEAAPDACATCHLSRPDGRLQTRFGDQVMNPPAWLFGMNHDRDFLVRHRWVAADRAAECRSCHRPSDCVECHDGRIRTLTVHPGDFLTVHAQLARRAQPRCQTCHSPTQFCAECHARLGLATFAAQGARIEGRYHPPAAVWVSGPVLHGREARRSMTTCTSCHAEQDCTGCHGAVGIGAGVSPHPPGFRSHCHRFWEQNAHACRTCHQDGDPSLDACR